jgi:excisionase family DNA binding protein
MPLSPHLTKPLTLTLQRAAETSGLSVRTLYNLIGSKKLESVTVGKRRLVIVESLEKLLLGRK